MTDHDSIFYPDDFVQVWDYALQQWVPLHDEPELTEEPTP